MELKQIISASINLSKIDKSHIREDETGNKYLNIDIFINSGSNQFGKDTSISIRQSKEEREAKKQRTYIGSGITTYPKQNHHGQNQNTNDSSDIF